MSSNKKDKKVSDMLRHEGLKLCGKHLARIYRERAKEKREVEVKQTPGEIVGNIVFEQAKNGIYIIYDLSERKIAHSPNPEVVYDRYIHEGKTYVPLPNLPWKPTIITRYESEREFWKEIREFIYNHIDLPEESGYDLLTAWVVATWTPELWKSVPYLFFYGPIASGKTWALEVLAAVSYRGLLGSNITPAVLFRVCDAWHPTLFLDEAEVYISSNKAEVINLLNSGYRKGQVALRIQENPQTGKRDIVMFDVFGFKALAGTKELAQALQSRCLIFHMSKAVRPVRMQIDVEEAYKLRSKLLLYRFNKLAELREVRDIRGFLEGGQSLLKNVDGRLRELFIPLVAAAPEDLKSILVSAAEGIKKSRSEEKASIEAMIFNVVLRAYNKVGKEGRVSIQAVANEYNFNLPEKEQYTNQRIGYVTSRLGFQKTLFQNRKALVWDVKLVERLKQRYPVQDSVQGDIKNGGHPESWNEAMT